MVEELNLRSEGARLGKAGVPAPDAKQPSGAEAEAIQRVDKIRQDYVDWGATRLVIINEQMVKLDVTQPVNRARQADLEFERKASALIGEEESVLRAAGEQARHLESELQSFKAQSNLSRTAVYPTGPAKFLLIAVLVLLVVLEGVLNSVFFAQGLDTGLIGGAAYAMALAALNVAVAYVLGRWPSRYIFHCRVPFKLLGWTAVCAALAVVSAVALAIGHFRDALTSGSASASSQALQALLDSPFALSDLMSWGLFGLSLVFAGIAFFDGMRSDDLYPGYGKVSRRADEALQDYEEHLRSMKGNLDELRELEVKLLETTVQEVQVNVARYAALIGEKSATEQRLSNALQDSANALAAVLGIFRQENECARAGLPRPQYFDQPPQLAVLTLPNFSTQTDEQRLLDQRGSADALTAEVEDIRGRIQAAFNRNYDLLKPLTQHFELAKATS